MVFCSNCGSQIPDESNFCPKCGTRTQIGKSANVKYPSDDIREAFREAGVELEKAFTIAAREIREAFQNVKEDYNKNSATTQKDDSVTCPNCSAKNELGAIFCRSCGQKIAT